MGRYDNYPDNVRAYDRDPRSPFYEDRLERAREDALEGLPIAFTRQVTRLGLTLTVEVETEQDEDGTYTLATFALNGFIFEEGQAKEMAAELAKWDREHPELEVMLEQMLGG